MIQHSQMQHGRAQDPAMLLAGVQLAFDRNFREDEP